jgi:glycosyltransferase involved in cell wall biosynthesis
MSKYTVLHTIEWGGTGGAETILLDLASSLDKTRFRSVALLPDEQWLGKKLRERGIATRFAKSIAWYDPRQPAAMARLIRQEKVDLIHSHLPGQNFYSCLVGRLTACKTVATYHGTVDFAESGQLRRAVKLWVVRNGAARAVAVCDHIGRLLQQEGFPSEKITRIYNGIDPNRFKASRDGKLRKELGLPERVRLVGMIANASKAKGYEFFVQAARKVADVFPQARFLAVGEFDPSLAAPLLNLVEQLELKNRFLFLGFREDVPEILSELDVFVLSSVIEGFPLVTLEAMAAGKPVVVTRSGGPQEVVEDGRTGFLVPPGDSDALAKSITAVLSDPARAAAMGNNAREKVHREFTLEGMVRNYERLYEELLSCR